MFQIGWGKGDALGKRIGREDPFCFSCYPGKKKSGVLGCHVSLERYFNCSVCDM